jgi:SAM-dependent methyltransferase
LKFDKNYTDYWSSAVNKSIDGTVIADANQVKPFLEYLSIEKQDRVLDLGCSFGRMYEALAHYSDHIFGIDPDPYAVERSRLLRYTAVHLGSAEHTEFGNGYFNVVFCWAVFDVVDHRKGLTEINRILKSDGKLLFTGKTNNYFFDDNLAFKAEKNAFLKGFPNKFTNLNALLYNFGGLGFELDKLLLFPRRGDFGMLNFDEHCVDHDHNYVAYEYLIICHKVADQGLLLLPSVDFQDKFSKTATEMAALAGFPSVENFFRSIGID